MNEAKNMRFGEGLTAMILGLFLLLVIVVAAKAEDRAIEHHAYLMAMAALAGIIAILKRYLDRGDSDDWRKREEGYNLSVIKLALLAALIWGLISFLAGFLAALELAVPAANLHAQWASFGRLKPFHSQTAVFAFGGNVLLAVSFYVVQRTCEARLAGNVAPWFVVWGYNLFAVLGSSGILMGASQAKALAEPEWYADGVLAVVWVAYFWVFIATLRKRIRAHIYIANWFFLVLIAVFAIIHIVNAAAFPLSLYSAQSLTFWSGVQDAAIQAWYRQNTINAFMIFGFLGVMYYVIPKQAGCPIYSHRLGAAQFWALVVILPWTGPATLHYTALPDWTQTLGMIAAVLGLIAALGSVFNGMMTVANRPNASGGDPVLRMMVVALALFGIFALETAVTSVKSVSRLILFSDLGNARSHAGALGWVAFMGFGAIYCLTPLVWGRATLHSLKLVSWHFWISIAGLALYVLSAWISGVLQGLMWRAVDEFGFLQLSFIESMQAMQPYYALRASGGGLFIIGFVIMSYNIWRTIRPGKALSRASRAPHLSPALN